MLSLRTFHLSFILLSILGADLFAIWTVWQYTLHGEWPILIAGAVSILGGLGLVFYAVRLVRGFDQAHIH